MTKHYVYILKCADNTLYTGYTTDPERREREHNEGRGKGAKYTRGRTPVKMVHIETFDTKEEAMAREYFIKHHLTRAEKDALINSPG